MNGTQCDKSSFFNLKTQSGPFLSKFIVRVLMGNILRNKQDLIQYWQKISENVRQFCLIIFSILVQRQVTWKLGVPNYPNSFLHQSPICHRAGDVSWSWLAGGSVWDGFLWGRRGRSRDIPVLSCLVWRMIFTVFAGAALRYKKSLTHSCLVYIYLHGKNFRLSRLSPWWP